MGNYSQERESWIHSHQSLKCNDNRVVSPGQKLIGSSEYSLIDFDREANLYLLLITAQLLVGQSDGRFFCEKMCEG